MKIPFVAVLASLVAGTALPALAAPDWQLVEKGRTAKQAAAQMAVTGECQQPRVLPLDHGPRAQTTPAMNAKRRQQDEARRQACEQARK